MHHPDSADSGSVRKMAHPAIFPRRGSNTGSGSGPTLSTPANSINNSHVPADDYSSPLLIQSQPPAGSSSPGPQHPPQSLNLHSQPQPVQSAGIQMKKKSGFQITSVTPAQISVSTNNSIAEDTESYDDLDESHTEDLSSSEILDVSLSRANDVAGAERSSSEETLNNFHEAETPGAMSPNQPHVLTRAPQHHGGTMVNGTVHHHHHQHHHQVHQQAPQVHSACSGPGGTPSALSTGALMTVGQKMPSNMGATLENVSVGPSVAAAGQLVAAVGPGCVPGMHSSAAGATVSIANPLTSNVSNVNMLSSANVPVVGGGSISASGGFPPSVMGSSGCGNPNVSAAPHHQSGAVNSNVTMTAAACASGGGTHGGAAGMTQCPAQVPSSSSQPAPPPAATSSRFRVVKLDSSSEPFKKGRWTCAEYYDKENPAASSAPSSSEAGVRPGESVRQFAPEGVFAGGSERESNSGSSVSSAVSTLSHYAESVGSGETGGPPHPQAQLQDYTSPPPQGVQAPLPGFPRGVSHAQPHLHPQDMTHAHLKTAMAPPLTPASIHQAVPVGMAGLQTTMGHPGSAAPQQHLTYAQAAATQPPGSAQGLAGVHQQQMGYAPPQQPSAAPQVAPMHVRPQSQGGGLPPDYPQAHPGLPQPATSQALPHLTGPAPSGLGPGQMMGAPQQQQPVASMAQPQLQAVPQGLLQQQPQQTSSLQASAGGMLPQMGHPLLEHQQQHMQPLPAQPPGLAPAAPPPNPPGDHQPPSLAQNGGSRGGGMVQSQPQVTTVAQGYSSVQAQASALYASLPSFTTTQLEDAQRLLLQHQSALLGLPKLAAEAGAGLVQSSAGVSALTASAGFFRAVDGEDDGSSGASVVAIDNKIEQAMDLVKSHLMYAVREEVEVLKEQIKELIERNSQLEQENTLLKTLASPEQMAQFQAQVQTGSPPAPAQTLGPQPGGPAQPASHSSGPPA